MRQRTWMLAVLALLLLVCAGCKSESSSPTSPGTSTQPPTSTSGGGTTPPVSPTVVVTVSNPTPLTNSTSVITATVSVNGAPVPNGTAVEFATTDPGAFVESGTAALLRTTTSGVATATLTSTAAGTVPVSVTVNNVTKSVTVKFSDQVIIQPPNTTVTVTGLSPSSGKPQGGDQITITGTNFKSPARVLFDTGSGTPKEGFVVSVTPTQIVVVTPAVDLGPSAQTLPATVTVISSAGNADQQRAVSPVKFTYALQVLTPSITTVTPNSGPIDGGTRVTIVGEAFQQPVQVLFGSAEAQVVQINFNQIIAISPVGSSTSPGGSGAVTGFVDVTVVNINSNKRATLTSAFRYVPKAIITAIAPNEGPFFGGTRVTVDGNGFNDPVTLQFAGVGAQVIKVSGSQLIGITSPVVVTACGDISGPTTMNNVDNGDGATGPTWIYRVPKAAIINIQNPATLGSTVQITVRNAFGTPRFVLGGKTANVVSSHDNGDGTTTFGVQVPTTLTLATAACVNAPTIVAQQPTSFDVVYTSLATTCTDTAAQGLTVNPAGAILVVSPPTLQTFNATAAVPPSGSSAGTPFKPASPQQFVVGNGGLGVMTVNSITTSGAGCGNFTVTSNPSSFPSMLNRCDTLPVTVTYNPPAASPSGTVDTCAIIITTDAGVQRINVTGTVQ